MTSNTLGLAAAMLAGVAVGAAVTYFLDPNGGGRRRALVRDKTGRYARETGDYLRKKSKYHWQRAQGMAHEAAAAFHREEVSDQQLHDRVRAALGRAVSNPRAIDVEVRGGIVSLCGPIVAEEVDCLLDAVSSVGGVNDIVNRLDVHETAGNIPGLQRG